MESAPDRPVVLQVLPSLVTGGVERGTVEITQAIAQADGVALVASAGGPMVARGAACRRAPHHAAAAPQGPAVAVAQRGAAGGGDPGGARGPGACALARAGLVGLAGLPPHRRAFRHHLSRRVRRGPAVQAPLQRGDGARRDRHRRQPFHRRTDRRPARRLPDAHPRDPARGRSGGVRPGRGVGRTPGAAGARPGGCRRARRW